MRIAHIGKLQDCVNVTVILFDFLSESLCLLQVSDVDVFWPAALSVVCTMLSVLRPDRVNLHSVRTV